MKTITITEEELLQEVEKQDKAHDATVAADPEQWWVEWFDGDKGWQRAYVNRKRTDRVVVVFFKRKKIFFKRKKNGGFKITVRVPKLNSDSQWVPSDIDFRLELHNGGDEAKVRRLAIKHGLWMVELMRHAPGKVAF